MEKLISVVIPVYNREDIITMSIQSVLKQTYKNIEVLVVDDNSEDDTCKIVENIMKFDSRIKLIRSNKNIGGAGARNLGIREAKGEYIAFLDSDDEWNPEKLFEQYKIFKNNPIIELVFTSYNEMYYPSRKYHYVRINSMNKDITELYCENFLGTTSSVMCTSNILKKYNGFTEELKSAQDWDLYLRLITPYNYYIIDKPLLNHMLPENSQVVRISSSNVGKISGLIHILNIVPRYMKINKLGTITLKREKQILCRLHYKLAKLYFESGEKVSAIEELNIAQKFKLFDVRSIRLRLLILLKFCGMRPSE